GDGGVTSAPARASDGGEREHGEEGEGDGRGHNTFDKRPGAGVPRRYDSCRLDGGVEVTRIVRMLAQLEARDLDRRVGASEPMQQPPQPRERRAGGPPRPPPLPPPLAGRRGGGGDAGRAGAGRT